MIEIKQSGRVYYFANETPLEVAEAVAAEMGPDPAEERTAAPWDTRYGYRDGVGLHTGAYRGGQRIDGPLGNATELSVPYHRAPDGTNASFRPAYAGFDAEELLRRWLSGEAWTASRNAPHRGIFAADMPAVDAGLPAGFDRSSPYVDNAAVRELAHRRWPEWAARARWT